MSTARTPKTLEVTQQHQLLDALLSKGAPTKTARKGQRNYLIGCLMLDAGLRVGEVVKLRLSHLYFNDVPVQTLVLPPSITKNHKERTIPISARLAESLRIFFRTWFVFNATPVEYFAFHVTDPLHPLTTRQVENIICSAGMKALGRPVNPHMLRHTFASSLMRLTDMRTVQELLGHNYLTSTQVYTHPNEDDKKKAIEDREQDEAVD